MPVQPDKNTSSNDLGALVSLKESVSDTIDFWAEAYFRLEVTTSPRSRVEQKRDLQLFLDFMGREEGQLDRRLWTPRLSRAFADYLQGLKKENGQRRFGDRTINRVLAHMKTFAKWIHKLRPFPLGNPMEKIKALVTGSTLEIEKALTPSERRRLLDSADRLLVVGGRSRNRRLARKDFEKRPRRKGYRPYRNRAVIYTLIETGMRRAAVCNIDLDDVDFQKRMLPAQEKGGIYHTYRISKEGMDAIRDYLDHEREQDNGRWAWPGPVPAWGTVAQASGRLGVRTVNNIWNAICRDAGVEGRTCHSARHAMGKYLMEKTGNVAAVQKQLGHKNAAYSMQYARITGNELLEALDGR